MSHVEEIDDVDIRDLDALKVAVERCGGEFLFGQTTHAWWGTFVGDSRGMTNSAVDKGRDPKTFGHCLHAIGVKGQKGRMGHAGPWEIGVVAKGDGYSLVYDNFGGAGHALDEAFGAHARRLTDEYTSEVTMRQLMREGWRMSRTVEADGTIVLEATN
jgi:hypothetical protein